MQKAYTKSLPNLSILFWFFVKEFIMIISIISVLFVFITLFSKNKFVRKSSFKWFTLVELIVVITILAILGTIAFISLQWYTGEARNAKRISDLSNIETIAWAKVTQWLSLISFIIWDVLAQVPNHTIAWKASMTGWSNPDYNAGRVNYTALDLRKEDFQDPTGSQDYAFWASTRMDGKYQLAAKIEEWGWAFTVKVKWNYKPRTASSTLVTITWTGTNNSVIVNTEDVWKLKEWDVVDTSRWNTLWTNVAKISADWTLLILTSPVTSTWTLWIAENESDGMIDAGWSSTGIVVTDGANYFPY